MAEERVRAAGRFWARTELRRRWRALVVLGLLAGVTAGLATAAVAGARRTDTAWERLRAETHASDAIVFASQSGIYDPDWEQFTRLPYVTNAGGFGLAYGPFGGIFLTTFGEWLTEIDQHRIVEGRAPNPDDPTELVMSRTRSDPLDPAPEIGVGDDLELSFLTVEQQVAGRFDPPEGPTVTFNIVGMTDAPFQIAAIPANNDLYAGPAFEETYGEGIAVFSNLLVQLDDPERDMRRLEADTARIFPDQAVPVYDLAAAEKRVTNGTDLERDGLLLFAAAVALAGVVIVGQALTRSVRAAGDDLPTLNALGFTRADAARALVLPHLVSIGTAVVSALAVALALSPRFPIGLGHRVDPDRGFHADLPVLAGGMLAVGGLLAAAVAISAGRAAREIDMRGIGRRSVIASALLRMGAPVIAATGASLALEPGTGRRALPTRPAIAGAIAGVLGVIGALTLANGIDDAVDHAERFGVVWDAEILSFSDEPPEGYAAVGEELARRGDVTAVARVARLPLPIGVLVVPAYAIEPVEGQIDLVVLEGREPTRDGEVVVGPDTADVLNVGVGDPLVLGDDVAFEVVGVGLMPTTAHSSFDQGLWVRSEDLVPAIPADRRTGLVEALGFDRAPTDAELFDRLVSFEGAIVLRLDDGVDQIATVRQIGEGLGEDLSIEMPAGPADQQNLRNVRPLPVLFAAFAVALAVGALAHLSVSVLRRRRGDVAVLRALGCSPGQIRACVSWQATTLAVCGLVVGLPLGLAAGRIAWRTIATATPMVHIPPLAALVMLLAAPVAIVVANLLVAWPGHRLARLRPGDILRTE